MDLIKRATKSAKNQPKLYSHAIQESLDKMKSNNQVNEMKSILKDIKVHKVLSKKQASALFILLSTTEVRKNSIKQYGQKKYQQAMLYLFLIMYKQSSFVAKFLMRSSIKQGLSKILK